MNKRNIITLVLIFAISTGLTINKVNSETTPAKITKPTPNATSNIQYTNVGALDVVANPFKYLYKNIRIKGKFDKYSTLGLDYPAAMRASDKYITFLIQRPDVSDHNIPLSELKIFLKKEVAEKNINLDAGDEIEFSGRVFSSALGDAWMDVDNFRVITKKNPPKQEEKVIE